MDAVERVVKALNEIRDLHAECLRAYRQELERAQRERDAFAAELGAHQEAARRQARRQTLRGLVLTVLILGFGAALVCLVFVAGRR